VDSSSWFHRWHLLRDWRFGDRLEQLTVKHSHMQNCTSEDAEERNACAKYKEHERVHD
jgi:hypothetical protein